MPGSSGSAIRGTRIGSGPMGEQERGEAAPRQRTRYFCGNGHQTHVTFSVEAAVPDAWECPSCGLPANRDEENPPPPPVVAPYKTHLAYCKERRSDAEAAEILAQAVQTLRTRRKNGEIFF